MMAAKEQHADIGEGRSAKKVAMQMIGGGVLGFLFMIGLDYFVDLHTLFDRLSGPEIIAFTLAAIYSLIALIVLAMSASRTIFMTNHRHEDTSVAEYSEVKPMLRWSSACLLLYAAALLLLALASMAADSQKILIFCGVAIAMFAQTAISVFLWRRYDELYRGVTRESCATAFVISEILLFIWVAATLCGLPVTFDPLAVIVAITGIYWASSMWYITKRGMV
jgi:hypothetical protein